MSSVKPVKLFYSYSHKDETLRDELEKRLIMLRREGLIEGWHDRRISAGTEWEGSIDEHLNSADVILLLVSPDFLASDYAYDIEVKRAMERHDAGKARVIPIILRTCDWKKSPLHKLQALPKDAQPVSRWADPDEAFQNIVDGIRSILEPQSSDHGIQHKDEVVQNSNERTLEANRGSVAGIESTPASGRNEDRNNHTSMPQASVTRPDHVSETFELVIIDQFYSGTEERPTAGSAPKFVQVIATYRGARVTSVIRLRAEKGEESTRFGQIIRMHERIKTYTDREHGSLPNNVEMIEFGGWLFDTLFGGDVRRLYDEARTLQRNRLHIVLTSRIPWIAEKPWEFAYDRNRNSFLATDEIHFIRNVLTNVPADPIIPTEGPLRILVVSAQPVGFGRLSIDQEFEVIKRGFEPLVEAGLVEINALARATPSMIHSLLATGNYQVVHFIGPGVYDEERGEGCLLFVNEKGEEYALSERSVRELFRGRGLSLVFLNACDSGRGGRADFNKGVAQSLFAHGLPALVANQYCVLDTATSFARHFYWCLAQGMSLGQSAREARIAVNNLLQGEPIDWAVPVVYARDPNATLCAPPKKDVRLARGVRASARRAINAYATRIAVWDMDNVFPQFSQTLQAMNSAQVMFGFELADLSVPLGVWDYESGKGTPYLWANHLADRLQRMPLEFGVETLVCVTRHWIRDDEWISLYSWWPEIRKPPMIILSLASLEQMTPEGRNTDRVLANVLVAGLAGFYGDVGPHQRGAQDCPLAFKENLDFKHVVEQHRFDAACRKKLKPKLGTKFDALEALLKAFHAKQ